MELTALLGLYSNPKRDPRFHTATAVYVGQAHGTPVAGDDAQDLSIVDVDNLPDKLAFDHGLVLSDYLNFRGTGQVAPLFKD
ncbi:MAG: NUDIX hydrolase [Magnetococcales bacterium]|nr:NUDIX hydrolase [Magnetococcales bacterium]